ncbi:membrane protein insertase YidC [Rhizobacter sp. SG703]|uniref:membrane protein insertase YidC n=1 Tax=Rhizobacter sp. SG703 TaxID=2587140 RepID=UPI00144798FA|nr:membrane protein insertase YidC [Rhizobacter sp. SG703]NKI94287.1 YidC/Oxa1 family membrane protein insertase [Rhizobacter sp. SG703]
MTDMRRTLLWVVFSMSLVLIWDAWSRHNGQPSLFGPQPVTTAPVAAAGPGSAPAGVPTAATGSTTTATAAVPAAPAASAVVSERVVIQTDLVKATLDSKGGTLARVELLTQHEQLQQDLWQKVQELVGMTPRHDEQFQKKNVVVLDESAQRLYVAQSGLIPAAGGSGLPNHLTVMSLVPGERTLKDGSNELQVRFESPVVNGVKLVKTYTFKRGDYVIGVHNEITNASGAPVNARLYLQLVRDGNDGTGGSSFYSTFTGPAIYEESKHFTKVDFKSIEKRGAHDAPDHVTTADSGWVAMVQHYFTSAWLIDKADGAKQPREYFTGKADVTNDVTGGPAHVYQVGMTVPLGDIAPNATKTFDAQLFVGPQEEHKLAALAPGLELVKDYGYFKILAEPLFWILTQLHKLIGNWGWSIIALVVLLKIAFYWLNASAYRSMAKMKAINPKVMELRERLKDKPQQMQQEMMRIYREEKVNPIGGCLPIIAQMPFFIALYWVLLSTVEMRNAPWIGWITDLSAKDPYFILPLLMTASSLLQTWLNPTPPDPVQAKMMWIMPLVFSVMFFFFPAGLVLYWLTNNILSIAQQWLINKQLGVLGK